MSNGVAYSFSDQIYRLGDNLYKVVESKSDKAISLAIIKTIDIYPDDSSGVTVNNMGHFEGEIETIERYQEIKLEKTIAAAMNLPSLLTQVKTVLYLEPYQSEQISKRIPKKDFLVCSKQAISRIAGEEFSKTHDFFAFEMYEEKEHYVGKNIIENWPFVLLLEIEYHDLVAYLKSLGLYEERWPFTHVWQNGVEFAQMSQIIATDTFRIWSLGYFQSFNGLYVRDCLMPVLSEHDYVLVMDWGSVFPASALLIAKAKHTKNIFWCANGEAEKNSLLSMGVQAHLVSHNAFINDKVFTAKSYESRPYSSIFNQTLIPFKRPNLTKLLSKVLYTSGSTPSKEYLEMIRNSLGSEVKINSSPYEIAELINRSKCGLALSQAEGGNYATTEYLLCGVPVVTTENIGGRDAYLDESNSVYCKGTPESVLAAVEYVVENPDKFDPIAIRTEALRKSAEMINTLKSHILGPVIRKYHPVTDAQIDQAVTNLVSVSNPSSKGRTVFQPEFARVTVK